MKFSGVDTTAMMLEHSTEKALDAMSVEIKKGAEDIKALSQDMAPHQHGALEDAHAIELDEADHSAIVYIDKDAPGEDGRPVGRYADLMHEGLYPGSRFKLGPGSVAKQAANPGVVVGGKFLERAADKLAPGIIKRMRQAIKKSV